MAEVIWSRAALRNISAIRRYIAVTRPLAAQRIALRLVSACENLRDHPDRGRHAARGLRELTTVAPYIIRYQVRGDRVEIKRIRHGARRQG